MAIQTTTVALIVGACLLYAVWTLLPAAARRSLAGVLLRLPLPAALARRFTRVARAAPGCGCDGCDRAPAAMATATARRGGEQAIRFHPPARR